MVLDIPFVLQSCDILSALDTFVIGIMKFVLLLSPFFLLYRYGL